MRETDRHGDKPFNVLSIPSTQFTAGAPAGIPAWPYAVRAATITPPEEAGNSHSSILLLLSGEERRELWGRGCHTEAEAEAEGGEGKGDHFHRLLQMICACWEFLPL